MQVLKGQKVSPGVAVGPVERLDRGVAGLHRIVGDPYRERTLFDAAVVLAKDELRRLQQKAQGPEADIFIFQIALLEDASFTNEIGDYISAGAGSAAAVERAEHIFAARLADVDDDYIRERSVDVRDACRRVVDILDGRPRQRLDLKTPSLVVADLFFPSDLVSLDRRMLLGMISELGSSTSHAAIMARSMGIPALCGIGRQGTELAAGHRAVLDAQTGTLVLDPGPDELAQANRKMALLERRNKKRDPLVDKPCFTKDGTAFTIYANCSGPEEIENALGTGAAGIGLVRTETLIFEGRTEEQQYAHYAACLAAAGDVPVFIRTCDTVSACTQEEAGIGNPAMGLRGVRLLGAQRRMVDAQLCALLRAGTRGNLHVMLPMIGGPEDWDDFMREVEHCKEQLRRRKVEFAEQLSFGAVIEVPAAALTADEILDHGAQFLVVGTNDLVQFVCAADGTATAVSGFFRPGSDAVRRLIGLVQRDARRHRKPVFLCGVVAETPKLAQEYVRTGITAFSVEPMLMHALKAHLLNLDLTDKGR
jgi:phosphoenolpyruvate-protein kinase (PTS system EI component)